MFEVTLFHFGCSIGYWSQAIPEIAIVMTIETAIIKIRKKPYPTSFGIPKLMNGGEVLLAWNNKDQFPNLMLTAAKSSKSDIFMNRGKCIGYVK